MVANNFEPGDEEAGEVTVRQDTANIRRFVILGLIFVWMLTQMGPLAKTPEVELTDLLVLGLLALLYVSDLVYSLLTSARTSDVAKAFLLQTAVPVTALLVIGVLAFTRRLDTAATITLFGVALGYTTYIVGQEFKNRKEPPGKGAEGRGASS